MSNDKYIHKTGESSYTVSDSPVPPLVGGSRVEPGLWELLSGLGPFAAGCAFLTGAIYVLAEFDGAPAFLRALADAPMLGAVLFIPSVVYMALRAVRTPAVREKVWSIVLIATLLLGYGLWGVRLGG